MPNISSGVIANAKAVWDTTIDQYGRLVDLYSADDSLMLANVKAFCKRPKIMGLFDRTEASYDQERYMMLIKASSFTIDPAKFMRARWDNEDHVFISVTKVDLAGTVFGYRILVKG